ncbi:MAG: hypothetical protein QF752_09585 [Planctomycetota bacterium]|jgi:hypothetical protein|nr:hypothetical protein [Planctomycetota bacterium]
MISSFWARFVGTHRCQVAATLFPVAADVIHWWFFEDLNSWLRGLLETPSTFSLAVILGIYAAYVYSLWTVRWLEPEVALKKFSFEYKDDAGFVKKMTATWPKVVFFYPSFAFGILMLMLVGETIGLNEISASSYGGASGPEELALPFSEDTAMWVLILVVCFFIFAHAPALALDDKPRYRSTQWGYVKTLMIAVLLGELALNLSAAAWVHFLYDPKKIPDRDALALIGALPLFLLFFASPRFTFMSRNFTWPTLLSGLALVIWEVWESLEYIAF